MAVTLMKLGALEYLVAEGICVPHCFTTRRGGVSQGHLDSLNIGVHRGDAPEHVAANYAVLEQALGFSMKNLVLTRQTHSDIVRKVGLADGGKGLKKDAYPECDALITKEPGTALVVFTADCTPILLYDPVTGAVGAVHAGWRGTASGLAEKTVNAMVREYGCRPQDIRAAIGPNIAQCCFETDEDVPKAMEFALGEAAQPFIERKDCKYYVNLKEINALFLRRAGVERVEISSLCTACRQDLFWSHRRVGNNRGSQGAIIICKEGLR